MTWKITLAAAALALASLSGAVAKSPLEGAEKPRKQCFWTERIHGFAAVDERIVNVRVGVKDVYQFELFTICPDIDWAQTIGVRSRGSSYICEGIDAEIISPSSTLGPQRCLVKTIRKLTPTEVTALKGRGRP